jgi:8-oxo-dGTP diphosphatase
VLLIQRKLEPFRHAWALPGGFVRLDETLDQAARRELAEEAGVTDVYLEQLYTFAELTRDPRERVVTVAYYALAKLVRPQAAGGHRRDGRGLVPGRQPAGAGV